MGVDFSDVQVPLGAILVPLFLALVILAVRRLSPKKWPMLTLFFLVGLVARVRMDGWTLQEMVKVLGLLVIVIWVWVWIWERWFVSPS
jgi:hypothetical protein